MTRKGIAASVILLTAIAGLVYTARDWPLWSEAVLPDKYRTGTDLWTATRSYSFGMSEDKVSNYVPCSTNCSWKATLSNSEFAATVPFRQPFDLDDDQVVSNMTAQLACVPTTFGYTKAKGAEIFPPWNKTHCRDLPLYEPRPKMWFDPEKGEFSMECPNGIAGRYILHPKDIVLTDELKLPEVEKHWKVESYPGKPVKYEYGEYVYGSCGDEFTEAILLPRLRPEVYTRAKAIMDKRAKGQPVRPLIVLFIAVDSFSRRHFYRKMPKTVEYLNRLNNETEYSVFDFKVHNVMAKHSPENMVPMFTNKTIPFSREAKSKEQTGPYSLWSLAKDLGYVTHIGFEACGSNFNNKIGKQLTVDHHVSTFFCVAETFVMSKHSQGQSERRCIGPHWAHYHLLNYTYSLSRLYQGLNQFHYIHLEGAHESSGQYAATLDEDLLDFLQRYLGAFGPGSDLAIMIQGDHGMKFGLWHRDLQADQELKLPVMYFLTQTSLLSRIPGSFDSLWHNSYRLVSKRDFRASILDLFTQPYNTLFPVHEEAYLSKAYILHREKIPDWRRCEDASIDPWYCSCLEVTEEVPSLLLHSNGEGDLHQLLLEIAEETVRLINERVYMPAKLPGGLLCRKLTFDYVRKAYGYSINNKLEQIKMEFTIKELSTARIETTAIVGTDDKNVLFDRSVDWYPIDPYRYQGYPGEVRVISFSRKDKYAGPCEPVSVGAGLDAEFCLCQDLDKVEEQRPGLYHPSS